MRHAATVAVLAAAGFAAGQQGPDPAETACPGCSSLEALEVACNMPDLADHAKCMCDGEFFPAWLGCRTCLSEQPGYPNNWLARYKEVIDKVQVDLCGTSPTGRFQGLFAKYEEAAGLLEADGESGPAGPEEAGDGVPVAPSAPRGGSGSDSDSGSGSGSKSTAGSNSTTGSGSTTDSTSTTGPKSTVTSGTNSTSSSAGRPSSTGLPVATAAASSSVFVSGLATLLVGAAAFVLAL